MEKNELYNNSENVDQENIPAEKPDNYMALAVISIFFSLIFGIVATVYASKVNSLWQRGEYEKAGKASKNAKVWGQLGIFLGIFGIIKALIRSV